MAKTLTLRKLHDGQKAAKANRARNNMLLLGRRWGKTSFAEDLCAEEAVIGGHPVAWSAPTYKMLLPTWDAVCELLEPVTARRSTAERRLHLTTGGIIDFWSADDKDAGRGRKYKLWVSDETQKVRNLVEFLRGSVRPTLADLRGEMWILGTPDGEGSGFHGLYLKATEEAWHIRRGSTDENPYIHPDEVLAMRSELGPELALQEIDARWIRSGAMKRAVQPDQWEALEGFRDRPGSSTVFLGVDASIMYDTTMIVGVRWSGEYLVTDPDMVLLLGEGQGEVTDFQLLIDTIKRLNSVLRVGAVAYDPYQMTLGAQQLTRAGVPMMEIKQGASRSSIDMAMLETIKTGKYLHPGDDTLTDHVMNAAVSATSGLPRLVKSRRDAKIDAAVTLAMAMHAARTAVVGDMALSPSVELRATRTISVPTRGNPLSDLARRSPF